MSIKVKLDRKGVREMLHWPGIEELITGKAKAVKSSAGRGFRLRVSNTKGKSRTYATISAGTKRAARKAMKHNTLLKALGSAKND